MPFDYSKIRATILNGDEDILWAKKVKNYLKSRGVKSFWYKEDMTPGVRWRDRIEKELKESDLVFLILSESSLTRSGFLQREIKNVLYQEEERVTHDSYIVSCKIHDFPLTDKLGEFQSIDLHGPNWEKDIQNVLEYKSGFVKDVNKPRRTLGVHNLTNDTLPANKQSANAPVVPKPTETWKDQLSNEEVSEQMNLLVSSLLSQKEALIFMGEECALSGLQNDEEFPTGESLINLVVRKYVNSELIEQIEELQTGKYNSEKPLSAEQQSQLLELKAIRNRKYSQCMEEWRMQTGVLTHESNKLFTGTPGEAHRLLAALSYVLTFETESLKSVNLLRYVVCSFDFLMYAALGETYGLSDVYWVKLSESNSEVKKEIAETARIISANGTPLVINMFSDLWFSAPNLKNRKQLHIQRFGEQFEELLDLPLLFIGYDFSDNTLQYYLEERSSVKPVFIVTDKALPGFDKKNAKVIHLTFDLFVSSLLYIFEKKLPGTIEKVHARKSAGPS